MIKLLKLNERSYNKTIYYCNNNLILNEDLSEQPLHHHADLAGKSRGEYSLLK